MHSSHKYKGALSETSGHIQFLESCLRYLSKLKTAENHVVPCIVGWQISIRSLLNLWKDLHDNSGFKFLLTNRLNQDCIETLFSVIRGKGGFRDNPDSQQFRAAFRHVIVDKLFVSSTSSNCAFDTDKILLDISNVTIQQQKAKHVSVSDTSTIDIDVAKMAVPPPSIEKKNIVSYMAGYLLRRYPVDDCDMCRDLLKQDQLPESSADSYYELIRHKETGKLMYPTITFSDFVQSLETIFCALFGGIMYKPDLLQTLCKSVQEEVTPLFKCGNSNCLARLHHYVKLYMTVRIHFAIKVGNIGASQGHKRSRKMLKLCHV